MNLIEIRLLTPNTYSFYDLSYVFKMVPFEVNWLWSGFFSLSPRVSYTQQQYYLLFRGNWPPKQLTYAVNFYWDPRVLKYSRFPIFNSRFSLHLYALRKRKAISPRCKNEALNILERYHSQSLFLFLNNSCRCIEDTFAKFVNAVVVHVYNCLCVYRYFSRYFLKTEHATFFSSIASCDFSVHRSFHLSITAWHFQLSGKYFLKWRVVTIRRDK